MNEKDMAHRRQLIRDFAGAGLFLATAVGLASLMGKAEKKISGEFTVTNLKIVDRNLNYITEDSPGNPVSEMLGGAKAIGERYRPSYRQKENGRFEGPLSVVYASSDASLVTQSETSIKGDFPQEFDPPTNLNDMFQIKETAEEPPLFRGISYIFEKKEDGTINTRVLLDEAESDSLFSNKGFSMDKAWEVVDGVARKVQSVDITLTDTSHPGPFAYLYEDHLSHLMTSESDDSSDLTDPLNPLNPLNPINPASPFRQNFRR